MAEAEGEPTSPSPQFLEVKCRCSGKTRRFAAGTEAGFAVSVINRKLPRESPPALHIQALKQGQEPIAFGPNSLLVDYGHGWNLETVTDLDFSDVGLAEDVAGPSVNGNGPERLRAANNKGSKANNKDAKATVSLVYIGKIIFAFILLFLLGAIFTLALENLPMLISFLRHPFNK